MNLIARLGLSRMMMMHKIFSEIGILGNKEFSNFISASLLYLTIFYKLDTNMNTSDFGACQNDLLLICNVISSLVSAAREDERWIMSCNSLLIK